MREKKPHANPFDGFPDKTDESETPAVEGIRRIVVTWGDEYIQPIQFNGFHTGSIEVEVDVPPGADARQVHANTYKFLEDLGQQMYNRKVGAFIARLKDASAQTRANASGSKG